jgi:hypothetical protein
MNFDLEAAKRGEPIEYQEAYGWTEIKFIGAWTDDSVVCQVPWNDKPEIVPISKIRMVEKKDVLFYRIAVMAHESAYYLVPAMTGKNVVDIEESPVFLEWIHKDWEMAEITKRSKA